MIQKTFSTANLFTLIAGALGMIFFFTMSLISDSSTLAENYAVAFFFSLFLTCYSLVFKLKTK